MPPIRLVAASLAAALLIAACGDGGNQPSSVQWRNVELELPTDWYVYEESEDLLSISNRDIGVPEDDDEPRERPEGDTVAMSFTYEPDTLPADWREFVEEQDATLESDESMVLQGDVPATRLVFSYVSGDTPTREMVVIIPSRSIVVLAYPIPGPDDDAPAVFLDYIEDFLGVLESAEFGAPLLD